MAKRKAARARVDFETVREFALSLPDVESGATYGSPAVKLRGDLIACMAVHKSAEPNTLAVRIDFADRDWLIADDPDVYYLKDHYVGYPCVLVRLRRIHPDALRDLLHAAWRFVNARARRAKTRRRGRPKAAAGPTGRRRRARDGS